MERISEQNIRTLIQSYVDSGEMDAEMTKRLLARILQMLVREEVNEKREKT